MLQVREATRAIAKRFAITGPFNIQFLSKDNKIMVSVSASYLLASYIGTGGDVLNIMFIYGLCVTHNDER